MTSAQSLRLPYWDWAKRAAPGEEIMPALLTREKVTVQLGSGRTEIDNPLLTFNFKGKPGPQGRASYPRVSIQQYLEIGMLIYRRPHATR